MHDKIAELVTLETTALCYVDEQWAYFTTQPLDRQWGDDWNDAPYEHNAGRPYEWHERDGGTPWQIVKVAFDGPHSPPCDGLANSPFSVQDINKGGVPWLGKTRGCSVNLPEIYAGESLAAFTAKIQAAGGKVYGDIDTLAQRVLEQQAALRAVFEYLYKTKGPDDPWASQLFTRLYDLLGVADMSPDETAALVGQTVKAPTSEAHTAD